MDPVARGSVRMKPTRRQNFAVTWARSASLLILHAAVLVTGASAQTAVAVPPVETIVARMAEARAENRARFRTYVVTRNYELFEGDGRPAKSHVIATVTFTPPDYKRYEIGRTSGSGLGEKLVRRMLDTEVEVAQHFGATDMSVVNYSFRFIREEYAGGRWYYILELAPLRAERNLLRGHAWVDSQTYLLHRAEGQPGKKLSWWLRDVRITFSYGDVEGMWLQTASEATANVRILGRHRIVSKDMDYEISRVTAGPRPRAPSTSPSTGRNGSAATAR
jgi:hypothetical protein